MKAKTVNPLNRPEEKKKATINFGEHIENFYIDAKVEVLRELVAEINSKIELLLAKKKS
jgi:hypothetical protein